MLTIYAYDNALFHTQLLSMKKLYLGTGHDSIQLDIHKNYKYGYLKMHTNKILFSSSNKNHSSQFQSTWPHNQREDMLWQITN